MNRRLAPNKHFAPDWISPPGETIADILQAKRMTLGQLARGLGKSTDEIQKLIDGFVAITPDLAQQLSNLIGGSAEFWLSREVRYQSLLADLDANDEWLGKLPINDMARFGWVMLPRRKPERIARCLRFFGVGSLKTWRSTYQPLFNDVRFRTSRSFLSDLGAVAAWIRQGEIEAARIACRPWSAEQFRTTLEEIRKLTRQADPEVFIPKLQTLCANCGVAVVVLRAPRGCRASGATRFVNDKKAFMLLSMRYLSDDQFWFSFFHEAGHLLLHSEDVILEIEDIKDDEREEEANRFAEDILVPPQYRREMLELPIDGRKVMRFAKKLGIAPGLVVGQLQHVGRFDRRQLNNLKRRYRWTED